MNTKSICLNGDTYNSLTLDRFVKTATSEEEKRYFNEVVDFLKDYYSKEDTIRVNTSGSTGTPKQIEVKKIHMHNSASLTCSFFNIDANSNLLLCMPVTYIAGKMMLVRALVSGCNLWVSVPSSTPFKNFATMIDFVALVPLQVYSSLQDEVQRERLASVTSVLIGGAAIDSTIEAELDLFCNRFYSSYGMTETVSHIALRPINGTDKTKWYTPLPQVNLSQTVDGALCIDAPLVSDAILETNDVVEMKPDGRFTILGRLDNVINSGGVKLFSERIEKKLEPLIASPFVITATADVRFGEVVTLLIAASKEFELLTMKDFEGYLSAYEIPKRIYLVEAIPQTDNGKVKRVDCRKLAESLLKNS